MDKNNKVSLSFAAIDKEFETTIPNLEEVDSNGSSWIQWGDNNQTPEYLYGLLNSVASLRSVINLTADYVAGDDAKCNIQGFEFQVNSKGDTAQELVRLLAKDYLTYGGFALQVIRNKAGEISDLYYIDYRYLRSSKKNDLLYYSEEWCKKYARTNKRVVYPKFNPNASDPASILYVTNDKSHTYPMPIYTAAIKSAEVERNIDEYHLSSLENGFYGSYLINFLNGIPTDEEKSEIEKSISEKFCGASNAGRVILNFANGKDNASTVEKLDVTDFSEKYQAAADRAREQILLAFGCPIVLLGVNVSSGFNSEDYKEAFKLYNRTRVLSIQRVITDSFDKIFKTKGSVEIMPFTIDFGDNENNDTTIVK